MKNITHYTERERIEDLRKRHECLIGWGAGRDEFIRRYNMTLYPLDHMIDSKAYQGEVVCGMRVSAPDILNELKGKDICFVMYPHSELEIVQQISEYMDGFSFIVSRLIDFDDGYLSGTYATNCEDVILAHALTRLGVGNPYYVDMSVTP